MIVLYVLGMPLGWAAAHERKRRGYALGTLGTLGYVLGWPLVGLVLWAAVFYAALFGAALALAAGRGKARP